MVEYDLLCLRDVDMIIKEVGYFCGECEKFQPLFVSTKSLAAAVEEMNRTKLTHSKFRFRFQKTLHKAVQVQVKHG